MRFPIHYLDDDSSSQLLDMLSGLLHQKTSGSSYFWDYLPKWILVDDQKALAGYYTGASNLTKLEIAGVWIGPILSWTLFVTALILVMLCINVILRKQWVERERLAYPITQIAFHLTHNTTSLLNNRITWIGFGIAASIAILNGFSFLYPTIPYLPIKRIGGWRGFGHLFTEKTVECHRWHQYVILSVCHRIRIVNAA